MSNIIPDALNYKQAGVDIEAGAALVERIKPLAARTRIPGVMAGLGGFGSLLNCHLTNTAIRYWWQEPTASAPS